MTTPDAVWKAPVTAAEEFVRLKAQSVGNIRTLRRRSPRRKGDNISAEGGR
jgi:hypothetical protein